LPSGWAKNVKSAILHVASLAYYAIVAARGWAANSISAHVRPPYDNNSIRPSLVPEQAGRDDNGFVRNAQGHRNSRNRKKFQMLNGPMHDSLGHYIIARYGYG
jgi:hypothetical protein